MRPNVEVVEKSEEEFSHEGIFLKVSFKGI